MNIEELKKKNNVLHVVFSTLILFLMLLAITYYVKVNYFATNELNITATFLETIFR